MNPLRYFSTDRFRNEFLAAVGTVFSLFVYFDLRIGVSKNVLVQHFMYNC